MTDKKKHLGYNIKRIREILGIKQSSFAHQMNISQQAVSYIENKACLHDETLVNVSEVLKVPVQSIISFDDNKLLDVLFELPEKEN